MALTLPQTCTGCPLFEFGKPFTLNEGDGSLGLLVCAEAPGSWEAEEGRPLSPNGRSGKVFRRALRELGIPAHRLTITNVLRSRPPDNELLGASYAREAIDHCSQYLDKTVVDAAPTVILTLGDIPLRELAAERIGSNTVVRGFLLDSKYPGIKLVSTYHPSYIARGAWQLFGAFKSDIRFAMEVATNGPPTQLATTYQLNPTVEAARGYLRHLLDNRLLPVAYDIETASILGEAEPADWREKRIIQIQFSSAAGTAVVLPWEEGYIEVARQILATENPKFGWNSRLSDDLALCANSCTLNGERHDLMNAWGHLQPSYWGKDKDNDADKGVPSRLMGLQSCASFYCPEVGPWKHLSANPENLQLYGAMDADYTLRCGTGIMRSLDRAGLMAGYRSHKLDLRPVLDDLGAVGLPVDRDKQVELREYVTAELTTLQTRLQALVPTEILGIHPKTGYKALHSKMQVVGSPNGQKPLRELAAAYDPANPPLVTAAGHTGYLVQRMFMERSVESEDGGVVNGTRRWCIERLYNPHGSSPNTKSYIRAMGYRMPTAIDSGLETTGKLELQKLAEETSDEVLTLTNQWRELFKTGLDYTSEKWTPGTDGRVHATFRWGTASAQTTAINPPVQTYPEHSGIAKRAKAAIRAEPGHTLVKIDMRGFHARMAGWLARDPVYYRLADHDVHSFVTAHFLHLPNADYLAEMDDDELGETLAIIKNLHGPIRNYKVKRVVHGVTFGLKARKLYRMYSQNFENEREAQALINLLGHLFPRTFVVFPSWVENQIKNVTKARLVSPFGHHRFFWDFDMEQATAFLPSNCSHCHIQAALVRLHRSGANARYQFCNFTHDAGWYHCPDALVTECIATVQTELERPSDILTDNPLGPFFCHSDVETGPSLAEMR